MAKAKRQFPRDFKESPGLCCQCVVYLNGKRVTQKGPNGFSCMFADESTGQVCIAIKDEYGKYQIDDLDGKLVTVNRYGNVNILDWEYCNGNPPDSLHDAIAG